MRDLIVRWLKSMGAKRLVALAVAPGLVALGLDAAIGHFAGKGVDNNLQLIPVIYGAVGLVALSLAALRAARPRVFTVSMRLIGASSALVGALGTWFHLRPLLKDLSDEQLTLSAIWGALGTAPPLFAPAAFIAVGGLVWALGSRRVSVELNFEALRDYSQEFSAQPPRAWARPAQVIRR